MSTETAIGFIEKVRQDTELYASVKQLPDGGFEHLQRLAALAGFAFSPDDWRAAVAQVTGPLSDEALEAVSGGVQVVSVVAVQLPLALQPYAGLGINTSTCGKGCHKCDSSLLRRRR